MLKDTRNGMFLAPPSLLIFRAVTMNRRMENCNRFLYLLDPHSYTATWIFVCTVFAERPWIPSELPGVDNLLDAFARRPSGKSSNYLPTTSLSVVRHQQYELSVCRYQSAKFTFISAGAVTSRRFTPAYRCAERGTCQNELPIF